jgi:neutral ceramidase
MEGYWYSRCASGIIDPLFVRTLAIGLGGSIAVVATVDLCMLPRIWVDESIDRVWKSCKIPRGNILVSCTHTHTGPVTQRLVSPGDLDPGYREHVIRCIGDSVELACRRLVPARVGVSERRAQGLAFNRRLLDVSGRVTTFKPDTYAASAQPAGPVNNFIRLLHFEDDKGKPIATIVNFGLHPDTMEGTEISADFPGVLAASLVQMLAGAEVLFLNGPCGDINHLDPHHPCEPYKRDNAIRIGENLAQESSRAIENLRWVEPKTLRSGRKSVSLAIRVPSTEQIENARHIVNSHVGTPTRPFARAQALLDTAAQAGETFAAEVSAITLGEIALIGLPGEMFTAWGISIRSSSPFRFNLISGVTNDYIGYIPTREAFPQGGYETEFGRASFAEESAGEKLIDAAQRLLRSLERGKANQNLN